MPPIFFGYLTAFILFTGGVISQSGFSGESIVLIIIVGIFLFSR